MAFRTATLRAARLLSHDVRELCFDAGADFGFVPGQWVSLRIPREGAEPIARSYSIASPPRGDGSFDLAVTLVERGPGSTFLHAMQPGASLMMSRQAAGFFTLPEAPPHPLLMVATGTGVAPLRSMALAALERGLTCPITLLFGVRTRDDVLYADSFQALAARYSHFRFEPTLSRPDASWTGRTGYVQHHLAELVALHDRCDVYVCGLRAMINDVRATLKDTLGFTRDRIHSERYD